MLRGPARTFSIFDRVTKECSRVEGKALAIDHCLTWRELFRGGGEGGRHGGVYRWLGPVVGGALYSSETVAFNAEKMFSHRPFFRSGKPRHPPRKKERAANDQQLIVLETARWKAGAFASRTQMHETTESRRARVCRSFPTPMMCFQTLQKKEEFCLVRSCVEVKRLVRRVSRRNQKHNQSVPFAAVYVPEPMIIFLRSCCNASGGYKTPTAQTSDTLSDAS